MLLHVTTVVVAVLVVVGGVIDGPVDGAVDALCCCRLVVDGATVVCLWMALLWL